MTKCDPDWIAEYERWWAAELRRRRQGHIGRLIYPLPWNLNPGELRSSAEYANLILDSLESGKYDH